MNAIPPRPEEAGELSLLRRSIGRFLDRHAPPEALDRWRAEGVVPRSLWAEAARAGLLGLSLAAEHGGAGGDFRHEAVLAEELTRRGLDAWGVTLHNAIVLPYVEAYGTAEQQAAWLPRLLSGEWVGAIAMTEPGAGSDLQAVKTAARPIDGGRWALSGSKTYITNGGTADFVLVVARTGGAGHAGLSLLGVEASAPGFARGRPLAKLGLEAADTAELFFDDVRLSPAAVLGGEPGRGFAQLMSQLPQERLLIAVQAVAMIERALELTLEHVKQRRAFGRALIDNQAIQFKLAERKTDATVARVFVDHCVGLHVAGRLDAATASMAKLWTTELQGRVVDDCLQLFGGAGYMDEYPIARMFKDARVSRIYGGTSEIMKLLIARTL